MSRTFGFSPGRINFEERVLDVAVASFLLDCRGSGLDSHGRLRGLWGCLYLKEAGMPFKAVYTYGPLG